MRVFSSLTQLEQAYLTTGMLVEVMGTPIIKGEVVASGEGLPLLSGNIFRPNMSDLSAILGRKVIPSMKGMVLENGMIILHSNGNLYQYWGSSTAVTDGTFLSIGSIHRMGTNQGQVDIIPISGLDEVLSEDQVMTASAGRVDLTSLKSILFNAARNSDTYISMTGPVAPLQFTNQVTLKTPLVDTNKYSVVLRISTSRGESVVTITNLSADHHGTDCVYYVEQNGSFSITGEAVLDTTLAFNLLLDVPGIVAVERVTVHGNGLSGKFNDGWSLLASTSIGTVQTITKVSGYNAEDNSSMDLSDIISQPTQLDGRTASADAAYSLYNMLGKYRGRDNVTTANFDLDTIWNNDAYNGVFFCTNGIKYTPSYGAGQASLSGIVSVENYVDPTTNYRIQRIMKAGTFANGNALIRIRMSNTAWHTISLADAYGILQPTAASTTPLVATRTGSAGDIVQIKFGSTVVARIDTAGKLTLSGSVSCAGLASSGNITAPSVFATGAVRGSSIESTGAVTGTSLSVTGSIAGASTNISGQVTCGSVNSTGGIGGTYLSVSGYISGASLTITGNSSFRSATVVDDLTVGEGNLAVSEGSASIGGTLSVTGATTLNYGLAVTGAITATGNITSTSDAALKSNVWTITDALNKVNRMRGVHYTMGGVDSIGVIAQEVQEVIPEVVVKGEHLSVAYGNLVGLLIEAVKELSREVDILKKGG